MLSFLNLSTNLAKSVNFQLLNVSTVLTIDKNLLQYLRILPNKSETLERANPSLFGKLADKMPQRSQILLRNYLTTPLADIDLINQRHDSIDFFIANHDLTGRLIETLKSVRIPVRAKKYHLLIQQSMSKNNACFWLGLIRTLTAIDALGDLVRHLPEALHLKVRSIDENQYGAMKTVNKFLLDFVNARASYENMELIFNTGVVKELDDLMMKKQRVELALEKMNQKLLKLPFKAKVEYLQEAGFMMCVEAGGGANTVDAVKRGVLEVLPEAKLITSSNNSFFYQSPQLLKMNTKFGDPWRQMVEIKSLIENVMINKVAEIIPELIIIESACSELDVLIALAKHAKCYNMKRPVIMMSSTTQVKISEARPVIDSNRAGGGHERQDYTFGADRHCIVINKSDRTESGHHHVNSSDELAALITLSQIGSFVPVAEMRQSVFWRVASVASNRHLSVVDAVSQFGAELSDMARILSTQRDAASSTLIILDDWGYGTLNGKTYMLQKYR